MSSPQPGDKVRVTVESTVTGNGHFIGKSIVGEPDVTVEVIQRADDPSKEEAGAVRRGTYKDVPHVVVLTDYQLWRVVFCGDQGYRTFFEHDEVVGWEKLTPVEGTPAAGLS